MALYLTNIKNINQNIINNFQKTRKDSLIKNKEEYINKYDLKDMLMELNKTIITQNTLNINELLKISIDGSLKLVEYLLHSQKYKGELVNDLKIILCNNKLELKNNKDCTNLIRSELLNSNHVNSNNYAQINNISGAKNKLMNLREKQNNQIESSKLKM